MYTCIRDVVPEAIVPLNELLQVFFWQQALCRARAELLEGDWVSHLLRHQARRGLGSWEASTEDIAAICSDLSSHADSVVCSRWTHQDRLQRWRLISDGMLPISSSAGLSIEPYD